MGADTLGESALRRIFISKAAKAKTEERDGGWDRAKGATEKEQDTEAGAEKEMAAAKAKERAKDTEAKAYMVWI